MRQRKAWGGAQRNPRSAVNNTAAREAGDRRYGLRSVGLFRHAKDPEWAVARSAG